MRKITIFLMLVFLLMLIACGGETAVDTTTINDTAVSSASTESGDPTAVQVSDSSSTNLSDDYSGALPMQMQLAVGALKLDETELAINETQAGEMLVLWQALQTLSASSSTADVEIQAVVKQIEGVLTAEQVSAIADMALTEDDLTALMDSGVIGFGRGNGRGQGNGEGGSPPGGGLPGGGRPGGGPGGGLGGGAEIDPNTIATRQAQMESGDMSAIQDQMVFNAVVRLLESKAGIVSEREMQRVVMDEALTAVATAVDLSPEELQLLMAEGQTLAQIVEANGGDMSALQAQLVEIFGGLPNAADLDLEQSVADWLGL